MGTIADLERILASVLHPSGTPAALKAWLDEAERQERDQRRSLQKVRHDLTTLVETANRLNACGLNLERVESYLLRAMMGQFGVLKVLVGRQRDFSFSTLVPTAGTLNLAALPVSVPREGALGAALRAAGRPVPLESLGADEAGAAVVRTFLDQGLRLAVPLVRSPDGGERELTGFLLLGPRVDGRPFSEEDLDFLGVLSCLYAMALHNAELYHRSIVDGLTQTFSRAHFDVHLALEVERARRLGRKEGADPCVALIMIDLDDFKSMNDRYGHLMGDQTLKNLSRTLLSGVRAMDIVARYGGEEFCVILPGTDRATAWTIAERLRRLVEAEEVPGPDGKPLKVTASFGVSAFPEDAAGTRDLIAAADRALYEAKEAGKNRVVAAVEVRP